jgi:hypothetical protein
MRTPVSLRQALGLLAIAAATLLLAAGWVMFAVVAAFGFLADRGWATYPAWVAVRPFLRPRPHLAGYRSPAGRWFKEDMAGGANDERMRSVFDAVLARGTESTRYLAHKGAFFLFGSDTPSGPTPGNLPGLNGYQEMQRLVAAGVSLRQLLEAARR